MFDAKSLLEALMKGAQGAPQAQPQGQGGGLGGLADILGQVLQQGGGARPPSAQAPQGGLGGGGLFDILGELQKQMGGAGATGQAPQAAPPAQGAGGGFGGLGDLLKQVQDQIGKAGQPAAPGAPSGQQSAGGGGLFDVLGQVLGQATSGVKEGAGRINDATGLSDRAREAIGQATGKSPEELMAQVQEWLRNNPGVAAAGAGGLGAILLGTRAGRGMVGSAAKLGALALIGGLAYKAYQNYQNGQPPHSTSDPKRLLTEAAPSGTGFEPAAISNDTALLYIRAMIAAAAADGRIDANEQKQILGGLEQAGIAAEAQAFLAQEIENPASTDDLASAVATPEQAVQVYTAARLAIEPDTNAENAFLEELAERLGIDANLAAHIDATAQAAAA